MEIEFVAALWGNKYGSRIKNAKYFSEPNPKIGFGRVERRANREHKQFFRARRPGQDAGAQERITKRAVRRALDLFCVKCKTQCDTLS